MNPLAHCQRQAHQCRRHHRQQLHLAKGRTVAHDWSRPLPTRPPRWSHRHPLPPIACSPLPRCAAARGDPSVDRHGLWRVGLLNAWQLSVAQASTRGAPVNSSHPTRHVCQAAIQSQEPPALILSLLPAAQSAPDLRPISARSHPGRIPVPIRSPHDLLPAPIRSPHDLCARWQATHRL